MIVFDLKCGDDHVFEAWFQSSDSFVEQKARGLVQCPACGSQLVEKAVMAPAVGTKGSQTRAFASERARIQAIKAELETNCDYVGRRFAVEARARFGKDGDQPRGIYGEASLAEAASLMEDGIAVAPLPFRPARAADA
ncbi:MAG: DUF1178 family protein [Sandaracinobacteroides sp.]